MTEHRQIDVLIFPDINLLDISGPVEAFHSTEVAGFTRYKHRFISLDGQNIRTSCGMEIVAQGAITRIKKDADLLIPGGSGVDNLLENRTLLEVIKSFYKNNPQSRLITICSGALVLASTGLLDGREATTHWSRSQMAKERFPLVKWNIDSIYTKSGRIYTSAGVSTGIDLALAIIEEDFGTSSSLDVAQELVVYLRRQGGQKQFSDLLEAQKRLEPQLFKLVDKITTNLTKDWNLAELSKEAGMSPRTLDRRFNQALGASPVQFVELTRLNQAKLLLAKSVSMKQVASLCGFGDLQNMRRSFSRHLGITTSEYLNHFGPS